jgi:hypothetical protein
MNALATATIVFTAIGAAGLVGLAIGLHLPGHHLDKRSRDAVRLVAGFLATLSGARAWSAHFICEGEF